MKKMLKIINPQRNQLRYSHILLPPTRMDKLKKTDNITYWGGCGAPGVLILLRGMYNGTSFGKLCFQKLRYPYLTIQQFLENISLPQDLIMNILSSFIPSCPKQETTRMSINKWIYKQIMVSPYGGLIWLHNKKEQTTDMKQLGLRSKLDEKKKIDIRVHTVWSHLYEILDTI